AQPEAVAMLRLPILLANGDQRFGMPRDTELAKRNFAEAKAALAPVIASAPIEVTIVGDVDENAAIAAVAASFGALPQRKLAASYGVTLHSDMSHTFNGFGYLSAGAVVAPDKADEVQKAIAGAAAELREKPVADDLLARARNPELEKIDRSLRDNGFWVAAV